MNPSKILSLGERQIPPLTLSDTKGKNKKDKKVGECTRKISDPVFGRKKKIAFKRNIIEESSFTTKTAAAKSFVF